jgi:hypothetical protein
MEPTEHKAAPVEHHRPVQIAPERKPEPVHYAQSMTPPKPRPQEQNRQQQGRHQQGRQQQQPKSEGYDAAQLPAFLLRPVKLPKAPEKAEKPEKLEKPEKIEKKPAEKRVRAPRRKKPAADVKTDA